jgi:hypothetical protein
MKARFQLFDLKDLTLRDNQPFEFDEILHGLRQLADRKLTGINRNWIVEIRHLRE